jgi:hypothetical protein
MTDVTNPNADTIPSGYLMEWATFTMDNNALGVRDGSTLTTRTWVGVMPRGSGAILRVALYDGEYRRFDEKCCMMLMASRCEQCYGYQHPVYHDAAHAQYCACWEREYFGDEKGCADDPWVMTRCMWVKRT